MYLFWRVLILADLFFKIKKLCVFEALLLMMKIRFNNRKHNFVIDFCFYINVKRTFKTIFSLSLSVIRQNKFPPKLRKTFTRQIKSPPNLIKFLILSTRQNKYS